jgi:hypothetical protein
MKCDAALDSKSLGGLCPVCLLDAALPVETEVEEASGFRYDLVEVIARGGMGVGSEVWKRKRRSQSLNSVARTVPEEFRGSSRFE